MGSSFEILVSYSIYLFPSSIAFLKPIGDVTSVAYLFWGSAGVWGKLLQ
jgi:hypothetical protein